MRALAGDLAMAGDRDKAERLLALGVQLIHATKAVQVAAIRAELLSWELEPALQDDLSVVLTQLRAAEHNMKG
jgi:hypothetical protein